MSPDGTMLAYALGNDFSKGPEYFNEFIPKLFVHFIPDNELKCPRWLIIWIFLNHYYYYTEDYLLGYFYDYIGFTIFYEAKSKGLNKIIYLNYLIPFNIVSLSIVIFYDVI